MEDSRRITFTNKILEVKRLMNMSAVFNSSFNYRSSTDCVTKEHKQFTLRKLTQQFLKIFL